MNDQTVSNQPTFQPRRDMLRHFLSRLVLLLPVLLPVDALQAQGPQAQLKVVEHIWGFDGRIQPGQFNPLSILLDNQTSTAIDATAVLERVQGMLNVTGGRMAQPLFIAPAARRWIQFYPYISDPRQCEWRLQVVDNTGTQRTVSFEFTQPRPSWKTTLDQNDVAPQMVILDPENRRTNSPSSVKHMPENVFPPYATVTFGLHTVFLDHVPSWETPRQEAFMSWLRQGGRLHLLHSVRGEFPVFSGPMVDLNQPQSSFRIGRGQVERHDFQRSGVTDDVVRRAQANTVLQDEDESLDELIDQQSQVSGFGAGQYIETDSSSIDDTFFRRMRELTMPEHAWWLIFLLAIGYIGLIFPGCFVLSKQKQLHFLSTYGAIVGLSIVFSVIFLLIGRRGYGETTNLQTIALARADGDRSWNMLEWSGLFVTTGDQYEIALTDQQAMLSTGDTMNRQDAVITTGRSAQMDVRIPPFSAQTFISRRLVKATDWGLKVESIDRGAGGLVNLRMAANKNLPRSSETRYLVLAGRDIWEMQLDSDTGKLQQLGQRRSLAMFCQPVYTEEFANPWIRTRPKVEQSEQEIFYQDVLRLLLQRSLIDDLVNQPLRFILPADQIRLMVYTEIPDDLYADVSAEAQRSGRILFIKDLSVTPGPAATAEAQESGE